MCILLKSEFLYERVPNQKIMIEKYSAKLVKIILSIHEREKMERCDVSQIVIYLNQGGVFGCCFLSIAMID